MVNLLPRDGIVEYLGKVFSREESGMLFDELLATSPWQADEVILFGKKHILSRKVALDGGNWLAHGAGNYNDYTAWGDAEWAEARARIKARNAEDKAQR